MEDIQAVTKNIQSNMEGMNFVGFWNRVVAKLLDTIIFSPLVIIYMLTYKSFLSRKMLIPFIIYYGISYGLYIFCNAKFGGTPGKLIMKYRIVNKDGHFISVPKAILRLSLNFPSIIIFLVLKFANIDGAFYQVTHILDTVFPIITLIDVLVIAFNKQKRALHDYMAGSFVITKESWLQDNKQND